MQRPLNARTASSIKIGPLTFSMDDARLVISTPNEQFFLSSCDTLSLLNVLSDSKIDVIIQAREEQREAEQCRKERPREPKTQKVQLPDGTVTLGVEIADLERERDEQ